MERQDIKYIPLALVGAAIGVAEVFIKPFIQERTETVRKIASASITYYGIHEDEAPQQEELHNFPDV